MSAARATRRRVDAARGAARSALNHDGEGVHTYYEPVCLDGIPILNDDRRQVHIRFKVSMTMHASPEAVAVASLAEVRRRTSSLLEAASGRKSSTPSVARK